MDTYSVALEQQLAMLRHVNGVSSVIEQNAQICLARATTYFVRPDIGQAIAVAGTQGMPEWILTADALPSESGFAWLDGHVMPLEFIHEWLPTEVAGKTYPIARFSRSSLRALLWATGRINAPDGKTYDGLVIQLAGTIEGITLPWFEATWRFGESLRDVIARDAQMGPSKAIGRGRAALERSEQEQIWAGMRWLAAFWLFVGQRIIVSEARAVDRHTRRRLERSRWLGEPTVRVVALRRTEHMSAERGDHSGDWSCQWIVRGHWRQQFYPSKHANQPLWITPYVKGPDDKPLKAPRATVFAVVR